ncbi:MAG: ABC transporter ATP-binding protein [Eubacteriales bacterium]|nr:ABC transporter ATP-binding protein [Eubacteriales bacterium]
MHKEHKRKGVWASFFDLSRRAISGKTILLLIATFAVAMGGRKISLLKPQYFSQIFALGNPDVQIDMTRLGWILIALIVGGIIVDAIQTFMSNLAIGLIDRRLQRQVWRKMSRSSMQLVDEIGSGEMISRTANDSMKLSQSLVYVLIGFIPAITTFYTMMKMIYEISPLLFKAQLINLPVFFILNFLYGRFSYKTTYGLQAKLSKVTGHLSELLHNVPFIKAKHTEDFELVRGKEKINELYRADIRMGWLEWLKMPLESILELIQTLITMGLGIWAMSKGQIGLDQWVEFMMYAQIGVTLLFDFGNFYYLIKGAQGASQRIGEMFEMPTEELTVGREAPQDISAIEFKDVSFAYHEGQPILSNLNFKIQRGERLAIVGKSGSGKTTLLNILMRLYPGYEGEILLNGENISEFSLRSYRDLFSVVLQDAPLLSNTVRENVLYGVQHEVSDEDIADVLTLAAAEELLSELEGGLDHDVGIDGKRLSGGQKQRLALARAFLKEAPVAVYDEPTASLDKISEKQVEDAIDQYADGRITILVSHDLATLLRADHILYLQEGKAHYGTLAELIKIPDFANIMDLTVDRKDVAYES